MLPPSLLETAALIFEAIALILFCTVIIYGADLYQAYLAMLAVV